MTLWIYIGGVVLVSLIVTLLVANTRRAKINRGQPKHRDEPGEPFNREKPFTDSGDTEKGKR